MTLFRFPGMKLFLAGLLVALTGTLGITAFAWAQPHSSGTMGAPFMGRMLDHMLDEVSATESQRTQIRQIMKSAAADMKTQREAGRSLHQRAMELFAAPTVDANAAEGLRQQMLQQHDQRSKRMFDAMLEVSRVLTPEQRATLAERMKQRADMMRRHHHERGQMQAPRN